MFQRPHKLVGWVFAAVGALAPALAGVAHAQGLAGVGEIQLSVESFGAGGVARPGEWTGLRIAIQDSAERQREVLVRVAAEDADGDRPFYEAVVTTNPGVRQPLWMYLRLPFPFKAGDSLALSAFAAEEGPDGSGLGFQAGRLLGSARAYAPSRLLSSVEGVIGVVDRRPLGLARYGLSADNGASSTTAHERMEIVTGLDPATLPDRWMGLAAFDVIVWGEPSPNALSTERAQAIREWVQRGGHLVVVLPAVGQTWTDELNNPLYDLVPRVRVRRQEGVDLAPLRPLLTEAPDAALPARAVVHEFEIHEEAQPEEAVPIIVSPPNVAGLPPGPIVVRRTVGPGAVTLVGLDLGSQALVGRGLPDADVLWHRILGRRGELLSMPELEARGDQTLGSLFGRETVSLDRDIGDLIAMSGRAATGVLLGFVVFVAYWIVAGPGGYALLKAKGWARHAWVAFLGAAGVFTAIAWGGAAAIRPSEFEGRHLTFLDHVYGQPVQRARGWISLLIPEYGETGVSIADPETLGRSAVGRPWHNTVAPWEPGTPGFGGGGAGFPDARGYRIDARSPDTVFVPARATVKQFRFDWAGGPRWRMPRPVSEEGVGEIRLWEGQAEPGDLPPAVTGTLVHELPGDLTDVVILVNRGQRPVGAIRARSPALLADVVAFSPPGRWAPGQPLDLAVETRKRTARDNVAAEPYLERLIMSGQADSMQGGPVADPTNVSTRLTALALYTQLAPPGNQSTSGRASRRVGTRSESHGWDLGAWFTRPCVIIIGQLGARDGQPTPIPLSVHSGGEWRPVRTEGRTVVRWVYPLPARPPEFAGADNVPAGGEGPGAGDE